MASYIYQNNIEYCEAFSKCLSKIVRPFHSITILHVNDFLRLMRGSPSLRTFLLAVLNNMKVAVMDFSEFT